MDYLSSFSELLWSCFPQSKHLAFQLSSDVIQPGGLLQLPISPNKFKAGAHCQQGGQLVQCLSVELEPHDLVHADGGVIHPGQ